MTSKPSENGSSESRTRSEISLIPIHKNLLTEKDRKAGNEAYRRIKRILDDAVLISLKAPRDYPTLRARAAQRRNPGAADDPPQSA